MRTPLPKFDWCSLLKDKESDMKFEKWFCLLIFIRGFIVSNLTQLAKSAYGYLLNNTKTQHLIDVYEYNLELPEFLRPLS